ncbi:hypothetical protein PPEP_a1165 [Pseudoalteromonas peptidolytica F12-50-A1]|uniref:Uncharacterized protein n=1 Tax=Pseudoalteromonas peptidolytica F12-50-A1 TaxID=1315280 RepID=A0A8I0MUJ0_9GAMM|nr:hypothetical protein [Pseudoalteromonas peptidolytica F12-50-A1]
MQSNYIENKKDWAWQQAQNNYVETHINIFCHFAISSL